MKKQNFGKIFKNTAGTIFLFMAAFFVFSTFLSMRAVFADPIITQAQQSSVNSPRSVRTNKANSDARTSRNSRAGATVARTASNDVINADSKNAPARTVSAKRATNARTANVNNTPAASQRGVTARSATAKTAARAGVSGSRTTATNRSVRSRTAVKNAAGTARISLTGNAIRGSNSSTSYTYLSNKLYTGTYSNILDPDTGLISNDAYNNCKNAYYTCMDEICTSRNAAQRRCACAGRVKAFATAETALETANEELIVVSGELALLIASDGGDVSAAFELTDAEKVMNCVSWQEANKDGEADTADMKDWCQNHSIYDTSKCGIDNSPDYCDDTGNSFGFNIDNLDGSSSDILASLQSWAEAKDATLTITNSNNDALSNALSTISNVVGDLSGLSSVLNDDEDLTDSLAETWGYELFEYAHNNVCSRVLDSCFNGIYEACGVPGDSGRDCTNGSSTCPYNYNTYITVNDTGSYELEFVTGRTGTSSSSCYGYSSSSDPYEDLRGPVADARRSVLQKYALDANADCDAYGAELKNQAQMIGYQKVAAQQALQQKRLEFYQDKEDAKAKDIADAKAKYLDCLEEIQDCRNDYESYRNSKGWTYNRIKSYCNTMSNVPSCYETMVCDKSADEVITSDDVEERNDNTLVQNVITLSEILDSDDSTDRGACLALDISISEIRNYGTEDNTTENCVPLHGTAGYKTWNSNDNLWSNCQATACNTGYHVETVSGDKICVLPDNAYADLTATSTGLFVPVIGARCNGGYIVSGSDCISASCPTASLYDTTCVIVDSDSTATGCAKVACRCVSGTVSIGGDCISE